MHRPLPTRARICPHCDGFPTVAITTGTRRPDGTRHTLTVTCRTCHGTGHLPTGLRESADA
ncbi:hypothetical protein GCM10027160_54790 [Streptomyces calidiresistens]|uniref:Uncharacterized protein n=1 Tax=Streptomyces calidiresistens TaxID=1485586 RepID=A0A7W3T8B5_9ACTN|nr:hypothetical protein [Streptomyces calidiresistens]MBB0232773.1 hypothetical protein [Streptomyces calidiresistens]